MNTRQLYSFSKFVSITLILFIMLAFGSSIGGRAGEPDTAPTPNYTRPETERNPLQQPSNIDGAPGYCSSYGGSTGYENISNVSFTKNQDGTIKLVVQVYIANPTGCTPGNPCPEYDNSPEYVNVWVDWNGNQVWDSSEKVMDKALTGYHSINYHGTMTAVTQFSPPSSITDTPTWLRANLGWGYDPNDPCEQTWTWGNVVDKQVILQQPKIKTITVQGIGTTNNQPETGSRIQLEADIEMPSGYEITKCSWTGKLTPGEGNKTNKCHYEYTPVIGPSPSDNTYGEKNVTLTVKYKHTASGVTGQISKNHT